MTQKSHHTAINKPEEIKVPTNCKPTKNMRSLSRLWRSFKLISRTLVYIPLGLLITLAILIGTDIGSRITVLLADILVPNLQITYISGALNNRLVVTDVHWQMSGISVELDDLVLDWHPLCLLRKQLCVDELLASRVIVEIDTNDSSEEQTVNTEVKAAVPSEAAIITSLETTEPVNHQIKILAEINEQITLPFGIDLTKASLANIDVRVDDMHFSALHLQTRAQWQSTGIRVDYLTSQDLLVNIPLSGDSDKDSQQGGDQENTWPMKNLPEVFMPIPVFTQRVSLTNSHLKLGHRNDFFDQIDFEASYYNFLINIETLQLTHTYGKVELEGKISLTDDYPMNFITIIDAKHVTEIPELKQQHATLEVSGGFDKLEIKSSGNGHIDYSLTGNIALADPKLAYHLALTSKHLGWPLGTETYSAQSIELQSNGDIDLQNLTFTGLVDTPYHPILAIDTRLIHASSDIEITYLGAKGKLGDITISGHASYGENIHWDAAVHVIDFDMEQLELPLENTLPDSLISGTLNTQGNIQGKQWQMAISQSDLTGEVQGYPFNLLGNLILDNEMHFSADKLKLSALQSILTISGTADEYWAVNALLDVPELNLWHPDLSGSIKAKINVAGESHHPQVTVSANALYLQFEQFKLDQAQIQGVYHPLDKQEFTLSLDTGIFQYNGLKLDAITLNLKGDQLNQTLNLQTSGKHRIDTQIYSNLDTETEQLVTEVRKLSFSSLIGDWELEAPFNVSWDNLSQTGLLSTFCWININGKLCLDDQAELGNNGDTSVTFQGDLGAILAPFLPDNLVWQAPVNLSSHLIWANNAKPQGGFSLDFEPGSFSLKNNQRNINIGYNILSLHASLDEKILSTELRFDSQDIASWEAKLDIAVTPDRTLSGYTKLHQIKLNALAKFLPQLEIIQGYISGELKIAGTLDKPSISGEILLLEGKLLATSNPTLLENIKLTASLSGQRAQLDGTWEMGEGQAKLIGNMDWSTGALNSNIKIKGKDLAIIQPPLAIINVSPDLEFIFNKDHFNIKGLIDVPSGHIKIVQLTEGGVEVSKDVVFNDSMRSGKLNQHPLTVTSNITIQLADELRIDGMGLRGKLTGVLELKQEAFKPALLYGDIRVVDGEYRFMGQTLKINTGEVQFIGPIKLPNLNIEAVREIKDEDVVAGVRITGTPLKPIVTLFSTPTKEQAEIISYIIKGTGFRNNDNGQSSGLILGAALTLSNQVGGGAVNNISDSATGLIEKLGFSNVQLDANDDGRVAISGFIGEDLMVKYGYGVFNPGYEVTVRYYLLSQLYLELVSGTIEQSLDIYYNFDID
ncbi:MAG: translocation/assembly module TamB domain-containing protein [Shewanella sp.]